MEKQIDKIQNSELDEIKKEIAEIKAILEPIAETYKTLNYLGKWTFTILVFLSILIGVILGLRNLFK